MSEHQGLVQQIASLDPVEREKIALALAREMFPFQSLALGWRPRRLLQEFPSIVSTPNICGGAARFIRTRIPVWTVVRMRQLGASEIDIQRSFPTLGAIDIVQAWSYAAQHRKEIEKAIRENEEE